MKVFVGYFFLFAFSLLIFIKNASGGSCGTFTENVSNRIVNGSSVGYFKYPWFAVIKYRGMRNCGGVLIANGVILTAAHCIIRFDDLSTLDVYLGINDICATTEPSRRSYKIRATKVHKQFQLSTNFYDIAKVFLDGDTSEYEPVCLPTEPQNDNIRPTVGWVQGFGMLYPNDTDNMPCLLQEAEVNVYNDQVCRAVVKEQVDEQLADRLEHAFCAGHLEGGTDACHGDSGGPLVALKHDSQRDYYELLGLVSFGFECAEPRTLVVYTDPSHFYDWLGI